MLGTALINPLSLNAEGGGFPPVVYARWAPTHVVSSLARLIGGPPHVWGARSISAIRPPKSVRMEATTGFPRRRFLPRLTIHFCRVWPFHPSRRRCCASSDSSTARCWPAPALCTCPLCCSRTCTCPPLLQPPGGPAPLSLTVGHPLPSPALPCPSLVGRRRPRPHRRAPPAQPALAPTRHLPCRKAIAIRPQDRPGLQAAEWPRMAEARGCPGLEPATATQGPAGGGSGRSERRPVFTTKQATYPIHRLLPGGGGRNAGASATAVFGNKRGGGGGAAKKRAAAAAAAAAAHGQSGCLGGATAGLRRLVRLHLKAWGRPPHS